MSEDTGALFADPGSQPTSAQRTAPTATGTKSDGASRPRRRLLALVAGPKDGHWYWLDDWQRLVQSVRAQQLSPLDPAAAALHYRPTGGYLANRNPRFGQGEIWRYTPPPPVPDEPTRDRIESTGEGEPLVCPTCHRPAPRLIVVRLAGRADPIVDCPRCAYPDQLYLSSRVPTMPAADQEWYAARVLVTGSRTWTNTDLITAALARVRQRWGGATLVHGAAPGADQIAAGVWRGWGLRTEAHPADWTGPCTQDCPPGHRQQRRRDGRWYCPLAGHRRNTAMVAAGANVCVAFIHNHSRGATGCADLAERAGIPTWRHHTGSTRTTSASHHARAQNRPAA